MPKVDDWEDWAFAKVLVAIFICERKRRSPNGERLNFAGK